MRTGGVENGLCWIPPCPRPWPPPRPAGGCAPAGGAAGGAGCCANSVAPVITRAASNEIRVFISAPDTSFRLEAEATDFDLVASGFSRKLLTYLRFAYVLLNPFRLFVTVNEPSGCTDSLIQYAGVCAAAPPPPRAAGPAPCGGAPVTPVPVASGAAPAAGDCVVPAAGAGPGVGAPVGGALPAPGAAAGFAGGPPWPPRPPAPGPPPRGGAVNTPAIVAGSSMLAMKSPGLFNSIPALYDQCNCHRSSNPGEVRIVLMASTPPPLRVPFCMMATRG